MVVLLSTIRPSQRVILNVRSACSSPFEYRRGYARSHPAALCVSEVCFRALAQHEFLDLAGRGLRQRTEHHGPRHLEAGEVVAAEGDDFIRRSGRLGLQSDEGA